MNERVWPVAAATGIGSMPGTDAAEVAAVIFGELPEFPYLPELPARGVGADLLGRTAALLTDLAVEVVPSGYRVASRPGHDHRRGVDLLRWDIDAVDEASENARPELFKVQLAGPWTLAADVELPRGHRVMTDRGAVREFTDSLMEGLRGHVSELAGRTGARIVVQLDEPTLPAVLAGSLSTPSGYGNVGAVPEPEARDVLARMIDGVREITGEPVIVHCCGSRPPLALLRSAGAGALSFDATAIDVTSAAMLDEIGETWDDGTDFFLGLVPGVDPTTRVQLRELAAPALRLVDRLGFNRSILAERTVATPVCGLAGASAKWMRRSLALTKDLGKAFTEPPEEWTASR